MKTVIKTFEAAADEAGVAAEVQGGRWRYGVWDVGLGRREEFWDYGTMGPEDYGTMGQRDDRTTGRRDYGTMGLLTED